MNKLTLASILFLCISSIACAQSEDEDTDAKYFFSAAAGLNFTQMQSSEDIFKQSRFGTGYKVGLQFNLFPDYDYQHLFFRLGAYYSKEVSESKNTILIKETPVLGQAEINSAQIEILFAYRFATEATVDVYLGGGLLIQQKLNKDEQAYTFVYPDGTQAPIFDEDNISATFAPRNKGPRTAVGPFAELGGFIPVGNRQLGIASGISYTLFVVNTTGQIKLQKANFYLTASYELF